MIQSRGFQKKQGKHFILICVYIVCRRGEMDRRGMTDRREWKLSVVEANDHNDHT